eukprot:SAG25_NODE_848_length_5083_cov_5.633026_5_plen_168_part_00
MRYAAHICCTFTYIYTTDYTLPTFTELERDTRLLQGVTYLWRYIYNTNKHIQGLRRGFWCQTYMAFPTNRTLTSNTNKTQHLWIQLRTIQTKIYDHSFCGSLLNWLTDCAIKQIRGCENEGSVSETLINTANRSTELTASDSAIRRSPAGSQQQDWSVAAAVAAVAG